MIAERLPDLQRLTPEEKLILVGELWDDLAAHPEMFPPRRDHIKLLEERIEHYRNHPDDTTSWDTLKQRILSSR
jgi:putative addiction module component (TIGR02574 family)